LLVDASAGNAHLRADASVAIDKVPVLANCTADWDGGTARPRGPAADIGADEYGTTPTRPSNVRVIR